MSTPRQTSKIEQRACESLLHLRELMTPEAWENVFANVLQKKHVEESEDVKLKRENNDHLNEIAERVHEMKATEPEKRTPYTADEISNCLQMEFEEGIFCGIAEVLRFYSYIFPNDRKALFRLAEVAALVASSDEMTYFKTHRDS